MPITVSGRKDGVSTGASSAGCTFRSRVMNSLSLSVERAVALAPSTLPELIVETAAGGAVTAGAEVELVLARRQAAAHLQFHRERPAAGVVLDRPRQAFLKRRRRHARGWLGLVVLRHGGLYAGVVSCEIRSQNGRHSRNTTSVLSSITVPVSTGLRFGTDIVFGVFVRVPHQMSELVGHHVAGIVRVPQAQVAAAVPLLDAHREVRAVATSIAPRRSARTPRCIPAGRSRRTGSSTCLRCRASSAP